LPAEYGGGSTYAKTDDRLPVDLAQEKRAPKSPERRTSPRGRRKNLARTNGKKGAPTTKGPRIPVNEGTLMRAPTATNKRKKGVPSDFGGISSCPPKRACFPYP